MLKSRNHQFLLFFLTTFFIGPNFLKIQKQNFLSVGGPKVGEKKIKNDSGI